MYHIAAFEYWRTHMNIDWLNTILVSISMSVDCMTVGATDGIREPAMKKRKLFLLTFLFGFFQYLMPTIGFFILYFILRYGLGDNVTSKIETYIPWIAFTLLSLLGIKNIIEWIKERHEKKENTETETEPKTLKPSDMILQSIATSIDALCIGFVYSPLQYSILESQIIFLVIGAVTFILSSLTTLFGKKIGNYLIRWAGLIAGIVFIGIGLKILLEGIL